MDNTMRRISYWIIELIRTNKVYLDDQMCDRIGKHVYNIMVNFSSLQISIHHSCMSYFILINFIVG